MGTLSVALVLIPLAWLAASFGPTRPALPPQDGRSFLELDSVDPHQVDNLVRLGRVWGFLKYHHPRVAAGELDWDAELFEVLPAVLDAADARAGQRALVEWIDAVGLPDACAPCAQPETDAHLRPELAWLDDETWLGPELSATLRAVHHDRFAGDAQHYVSLVPGVGNPVFAREAAYADVKTPDAGLRLLALFRFWNIIAWWFPYRDLIEEDWGAVLAEFVPRLIAARDRDAYPLELMALVARVHDTHANLWSSLEVRPPIGPGTVPVILRFVEGRPFVAEQVDPAHPTTSLRIGDALLALEGRPVEELVREWTPWYADSNPPTRLRDVARQLLRGPLGPVHLRVERDGVELELEETRVPRPPPQTRWHDLPGPAFRLLSPDVAYLKLSEATTEDAAEYVREAQGTRGWVLDLRNYPKAFLLFALGQHLVSEPTPFARFTAGSTSNPGAFVWTEPVSLSSDEPHYPGRLVLLVDESTQSSAEYHAMAFRAAPDALVIGSTTAGADGNVSPIPLPGGLRAMISGIGVFYPDKTPTQRVGIVPDRVVTPTIAGLRAGRDEVLEAGVQAILGPDTEAEARRIVDAALRESR